MQPTNTAQRSRILRDVDPGLVTRSNEAVAGTRTSLLTPKWNGPTFYVHDPATEEVIASVPEYSIEDSFKALDQAEEAGRKWAKTTPRLRSDTLQAVYARLIENQERLALVMTREMGKPLTEARGEVQYAADYVRWYAEEILRPQGNYRTTPNGDGTILTSRGPVGTTLLISPWNFPMAMATRKIAPALAAGCAAIVKPAALTPLTTLLVVQLMVEAGVPEELVRVITTKKSAAFSAALMADQRIRKVSFTGSTGVGSVLLSQAAQNITKASMELGGNAPFIIFDDADLERAVEGAYAAKMRNGGQSCVAANRFLVQEGIADDFVAAFGARMASVAVGNGLMDGVALGPVISEGAAVEHENLIRDAISHGAELVTGGERPAGTGHFVEPTVLDHVPASARIATTEIFGPVAAISRFKTQDEAIEQANDTPFGLAGYVFSESVDRVLTVADALEVGMVGINNGVVSNVAAPFGGVKQSGLGREGSGEGLEEYQEIRFYNISRRTSR